MDVRFRNLSWKQLDLEWWKQLDLESDENSLIAAIVVTSRLH